MNLAIGIDLGGSKIAGVLLNEHGKVLTKYIRPTESYKTKQEIMGNVLEVINLLKREGVVGIGIGAPGFFDEEGHLVFAPNVKNLRKINVKKEIQKRSRLPVTVFNDAKCFALAEHRFGAGRGIKNMVGVVIGTGVGSGIIINGRIYEGIKGGAGEIGHTKIIANGELTEFESLISGPALLKRYEELSGKTVHRLSEIAKSNAHYKKAYDEFVYHTSILFANIINTLTPDAIIVGGGVSHINFFKDVERRMKKYAIRELAKPCRVRRSKLGDDSGAIGAALLAFERFNNKK